MTDYNLNSPQMDDYVQQRAADGTAAWTGQVGGKLREPRRVVVTVDGDPTPKEIEIASLHWDADGGPKKTGCWFFTA